MLEYNGSYTRQEFTKAKTKYNLSFAKIEKRKYPKLPELHAARKSEYSFMPSSSFAERNRSKTRGGLRLSNVRLSKMVSRDEQPHGAYDLVSTCMLTYDTTNESYDKVKKRTIVGVPDLAK